MRRFVIGDIHGNYKALIQCLERSGFNYDRDLLINLGDVVDGWPYTKDCIDELLKIKNRIDILGNHDYWAWEWFVQTTNHYDCMPERLWTSQGGQATLESYKLSGMPDSHKKFLDEAVLYCLTEDNKLFVHAGIDNNLKIEYQNENTLLWDRQFIQSAWQKHHQNPEFKFTNGYGNYNEIFIGHTTTQWFARNKDKTILTPEEINNLGTQPLFLCNVICMDTGSGWSGKLTIMNIDTKEYWQSDLVKTLYPDIQGRP